MKRLNIAILLLFLLPIVVSAQTLDKKLKEIDAYANTVMDTWH